MSPPRRRSARLASSSTNNSTAKENGKAATKLASLCERDETPLVNNDAPQQAKTRIPTAVEKSHAKFAMGFPDPPKHAPSTPVASSPIKPSHEEMHPSKAHANTQPPSGLHLGFADIKSVSLANKTPSKSTTTTSVPSGKAALAAPPPSSPFTFRFDAHSEQAQQAQQAQQAPAPAETDQKPQGDDVDLGLSSEARRMMEELREEAMRIRKDLADQRDMEQEQQVGEDAHGRRFAKPRGKSGRFSAAHMAQFKKMDSIEGHPSAFRAAQDRFAPGASVSATLVRSPSKPNLADSGSGATAPASNLKRKQSKANLNDPTPALGLKRAQSKTGHREPETATTSQPPSNLKRFQSKANLWGTAAVDSTPRSLKRTQSKANLHDSEPGVKAKATAGSAPKIAVSAIPAASAESDANSSAKRVKQRAGDDASTGRPISRDASSIPRPKSSNGGSSSSNGSDGRPTSRSQSNLASLLSPTKAVQARVMGSNLPLPPAATPAGPKRQIVTYSLSAETVAECKPKAPEPGRLEKLRAMFLGQGSASDKTKSAIPLPSTSQTPATPRANKALPVATPLTGTPTMPARPVSRDNHLVSQIKQAALLQDSPSPVRIMVARAQSPRAESDPDHLPTADKSAEDKSKTPSRLVTYPDLSKHKEVLQSRRTPKAVLEEAIALPASVPGTFTFRSDHTINFGSASPSGFGGVKGQSSIRQVRASMMASVRRAVPMPGGFPDSEDATAPLATSDKENSPTPMERKEKKEAAAVVGMAIPHGLANKKRGRPTWAEEDREQQQEEEEEERRRHKKIKSSHHEAGRNPFATGPTVLSSPIKGPLPQTPKQSSAVKRKPFLSISRLNMLAQPKIRR